MRASILIDNFNDDTFYRQPWNHAFNVAKELVSLGCDVSLFTNYQPTKIISIFNSNNKVSIHMLPNKNLRSLDRNSYNNIKKENPDVIYWFGNSLSGLYLKKMDFINVPIVLHISSSHYAFSELILLSRYNLVSHLIHLITSIHPLIYLVRTLNIKKIQTIIVPNKFIKIRLTSLGVLKQKIIVAPLTFNVKEFLHNKVCECSNLRFKYNLNEHFLALYLGSSNTIRGTDILLKAVNILTSKIDKFQLLFLFRQDYNEKKRYDEYLVNIIKKCDLDNTIKIINENLSKEEIISYITISDVVVLPYKMVQSEPPLALLEAMALGKPVITTKTCGLPEIINFDRGLLVKPGNAHDLAEALSYLARNSKKAIKLGKQAKDFILALPNLNELGRWTIEVLYQAIKNNC